MQGTEKKHIVWLCSGLHQPGGTERANLNAAHLMLKKGYRVTIIVMDSTGQSFYPLDPAIHLIHKKWFFGIAGSGNPLSRKTSMLREFYALKKMLVQLDPYAVIATDYPFAVACVFTGLHKKFKVFSWEHHHYSWLKKNRFWQMMTRYAYPKLRSILVYNPDEAPWYEKMGCHTAVIPNFIEEMPQIQHEPQSIILTVGWLIERKGMDLIPAMAQRILTNHPGWKWIIIGEGALENKIRKEITERGLEEKLLIRKPVKPLEAADYQQASVYVMTSRQEPFGLVLIEAMNNGLPCIAFDCPSGPRHIIHHQEDGFLVSPFDTKSMESFILQLVEDEQMRKQMGAKAINNVNKYSAEAVWLRWENVLEN